MGDGHGRSSWGNEDKIADEEEVEEGNGKNVHVRMFIHSNIFEQRLCARHCLGTWDPSVYVASQTIYKRVIVERVTAS